MNRHKAKVKAIYLQSASFHKLKFDVFSVLCFIFVIDFVKSAKVSRLTCLRRCRAVLCKLLYIDNHITRGDLTVSVYAVECNVGE